MAEMILFKYCEDEIFLGPSRPTNPSFPSLVCCNLAILTSPTNFSEKNIRSSVDRISRSGWFTYILGLRSDYTAGNCGH